MKKYLFSSMVISILFCGIIFIEGRVYAAPQSNIKFYDKSPVALRLPDKRELDRIRKDKAFQYEKKIVSGNTIADVIGSWINWLREHFFSHIFSKEAQLFWRIFPYIIMAGAIVIVILALRRGDFLGLFSRKRGRTGEVLYDPDEDIHEIDFDSMIKKFVDNNDCRMALRYRFLKTLKNLSIKGIIVWQKDKTNRDYVKEMTLEIARSSFNELVNIFEYVWYGSFNIDRNFLEQMNERFSSFDFSVQDGDSIE
jgi:hypothetical protein